MRVWSFVRRVRDRARAARALERSGAARADEGRRGGADSPRAGVVGGHGPIGSFVPSGRTGFSAEMAIINDGKEPLVLSRISPRADPADPRVPPTLTAHLSDGSLPISIAPGTTRRATLSWKPEKDIKARQLFGHIVVTSSDEAQGDVAMGVKATLPGLLGPLEPRILSLLLLLPILGALAALIAKNDPSTARAIAIGALALQTLLGAYVYRGFVPDLSRIDGNDGLQFIGASRVGEADRASRSSSASTASPRPRSSSRASSRCARSCSSATTPMDLAASTRPCSCSTRRSSVRSRRTTGCFS